MEWIRFVTISFAIVAIIEMVIYFRKEPAIYAAITWLFNVVGYSIFKSIAGSSIDYYQTSVIWSNVLLLHGIILLISASYIFRKSILWKTHK